MQRIILTLLTACGLGITALLATQPASGDLSRIPVLALPAQDNDALLRQELAARTPGRAPHYAVTQNVNVRPTTHGSWADHADGTSSWRLRVQSPNAKSINFGFTEYWMPRNGQLFMYSGGQKGPKIHGPFTAADNEVHNQLWTQVIGGDDLVIEVILPTTEKNNLRLWLTDVNHDFLGFGTGSQISGSCNLDVVCSEIDGWGIVDQYRDIIRSVAVISTGGGTFCTGFLVNNARQDCTPYFMTANHCGIGAGNAPSLVTYWNFDNTFCRQPGSGASGGPGDGELNDFNTGATWRASNAASDMTIVELDDEVSPTANAFYAGWSREETLPTDTVIAIHHPSTDEKRISFTFQQTYRGAWGSGATAVPNGTHLIIPDWNIGTTEGGSSGSPVFDRFHRIRGQLHGGAASCGNDAYDSYGYFFTSWEGGGTPSSRLKDWLDPDNTGVMFIDGKEQLSCQISVSAANPVQTNCAPEATTYNLLVGGGFTNPVTVSIDDLPAGLTAVFSQTTVAPNTPITLTVTPAAGIDGTFSFTINANDGVNNSNTPITLNLEAAAPAAPNALSPANGAVNQPVVASLNWSNVTATSYQYQLATEAGFTNLLTSGTTAETSYIYPELLDGQTTYYWRVRATNVCGQGAWSATNSFTTLNQVCGAASVSDDVPVAITEVGTPTVFSILEVTETTPISFMTVDVDIEHTYVGDLELVLTSPEGTEIILVDRIGTPDDGGFGCGGNDFQLSFSDGAMNTNDDLEGECANLPAASGEYQPQQPLASFNGESPEGTWLLTVIDNAAADGGNIVGWSIVFCGAGQGGLDFSLNTVGDNPTSCAIDGATVQVSVGPDFGGEITPSVTIDGNPVANVMTSFNSSSRILTLDFANFTTLAPGQHTIQLVVASGSGSNNLNIPLTIEPTPTIASPTAPANGSTIDSPAVSFTWNAALNVVNYTLQVATDETFATIDYSAMTTATTLEVSDLNLNGLIYWRVVANNECGNAVSGSRNFTNSPNATHDFAGGRTIALFPNPTAGNLFISMEGNWSGELSASIMSVHGQVMGNWILPAGGRQQLNVSQLPAGTYLVDLRNGTDRAVERIVILR